MSSGLRYNNEVLLPFICGTGLALKIVPKSKPNTRA